MSLERLSKQLSQQQQELPPVELWDPPYCGEMDMQIKADGRWFYMGSEITRQRLVKLFSTVLKKQDDEYFLVTPVEKIKIQVEHLPFVITQWHWLDDAIDKTMLLTTNLGDQVILDSATRIQLNTDGTLQVNVRRNLDASIHRNVFYQWAELAEEKQTGQQQQLVINSGGVEHTIGVLEND
ncbi:MULTISPECIES: DUF1285 domain-containing protein [unclassified Thalassotalea]|uniref:DUF1285 domain-containing protein n=1 Tax=unclassified Thalassotalea TaxID=2614972 RepID=UPI00108183BF|nr:MULTISPECIES: DUF1285 domain-containing protein [unclassified Thalassotalea]NMP16889.1 DUF1285 domain-containing protein [Thalassotalea sp. Y01]QBY04453.1 DUF1285 domain-containing protein [Thalassotalea sp. HSM 43]